MELFLSREKAHEKFIKKIKKCINIENNEFIEDGLIEWHIDNWKSLHSVTRSPKFTINNHNWKFQLYKSDANTEYTSIYFINVDLENDKTSDETIPIPVKFVIYIRNFHSNENEYKVSSVKLYRNENKCFCGFKEFVKESKLFSKDILFKNECDIGVYYQIYKYEKENYFNDIVKMVKYEDKEVESKGFYEWYIENWNDISNEVYSPEFMVGEYRWKLKLNPYGDGKDNSEFVSLNLCNLDVQENIYPIQIPINFVLYIRNKDNFDRKEISRMVYFNRINNSFGNNQFIKRSELFKKDCFFGNSLVDNNRCIIGVYICTYKRYIEPYIIEIMNSIKLEKKQIIYDGLYELRIENWNQIPQIAYSPEFTIGHYKWKLKICSYNFENPIDDFTSVYLESLDIINGEVVHIPIKASFYIRSYDDPSVYKYQTLSPFLVYNKNNGINGIENFIKKPDVYTYIENNKCIIGVYFQIFEYDEEFLINEIKSSFNNKEEIESEGFYEWKIENWDNLSSIEYSPEFKVDNNKWRLCLYPEGYGSINYEYISAFLENVNYDNDYTHHIPVKYALYIRSYDDYSFFDYNVSTNQTPISYFSMNNKSDGNCQFIQKSKVLMKSNISNKSIIDNNKCAIGVYIRTYKYKKDNYINVLNTLFDENKKIENDEFYEWKIENWDQLSFVEHSPEFTVGKYRWKLQIFPNINRDNRNINRNYVSISLKNLDVENDCSVHIPIKCFIYIRNYNDPSVFAYQKSDLYYFDKNKFCMSCTKIIKVSELYTKNGEQKKSIIEDNKCIVGIHLRIYKYENEYINAIQNSISNHTRKIKNIGFYEWEIEYWEQLPDVSYSPEFILDDYIWNIKLCQNRSNDSNGDNFISVYLNNTNETNNDSKQIPLCYSLYIRNYYDNSIFDYKGSNLNFINKSYPYRGYQQFIKKSELIKKNDSSNRSLLENNKCVIGVVFCIYKYSQELFENVLSGLIYDDRREVIKKGLFEWEIENWKRLSNIEYSPNFTIGDYIWNIILYPNGNDDENFVSVYLRNQDVKHNDSLQIPIKYVFFVRRYDDYYYNYNYVTDYCYINKKSDIWGLQKFIKKSAFYAIDRNSNKNFIKDNKCIVGVYLNIYKNDKDMIKNKLKRIIKHENKKIESEGFFEWEFDNWNQLSGIESSTEFKIGKYKWKLKVYPNGNGDTDTDNFVSVYLNNVDVENDDALHIPVKLVIYIRNYKDVLCFDYKQSPSFMVFNKSNVDCGFHQFISKSDMTTIPKNSNLPLFEDNKCVFGVYFYTYEYEEEFFIKELKCQFDDENESEGIYEWKVEKYDQLKDEEFSSEFTINNSKWQLKVYPNGNGDKNKDYLSVYLHNKDIINDYSIHIPIKFTLYVRNYNDYYYKYKSIKKQKYFTFNENDVGLSQFIKKSVLYSKNENLNKSIIENNKCIIGVYYQTYNEKGNYMNILKNITNNENMAVKNDGFYEWNIDNWNELSNKYYSPEFDIGNYKWRLKLFPNGNEYDDKENVVVHLENLDVSQNKSTRLCIKYMCFIRNYKNSDIFIHKDSNITYYGRNITSSGLNIIEKSKLYSINGNTNQPLIEDNKCVVGIYLQIYKESNAKGNYNKSLQESSESLEDSELSSLVIAISNFSAFEYDQLDIKIDEFLIVTDWNCKEGWVYGYRKNNEKEKGFFPKVFVKCCRNNNNGNSTNSITPQYKIEFEHKVEKLLSLDEMRKRHSKMEILIDRYNLFDDSYNLVMGKSPYDLKKRLKINFKGEFGADAGGLLRDFFYQISKVIGNPNYSLFQYANENSYELKINSKSGLADPDHLKYFKFVGRIIGLAIYHGVYLSISFNLSFYKRLLNIPLEYSDLEHDDPKIYKNINWLKNNENVENLCLTFEIDVQDCFGNYKNIELKPNGSNIIVTDENKNEYIDLIVKNRLIETSDREQMDAIKEGFYEIIPYKISSIFNEVDLKYLINGINEIDVDDWERNTDYDGYNKNDITIINFWKCVREFSNDKRLKLLVFATGNSQVPVTGFKNLQGKEGTINRFNIVRVDNTNNLPKSHTCFNRIDLPPYTSHIQLKQKLLFAITEGLEGFQFY